MGLFQNEIQVVENLKIIKLVRLNLSLQMGMIYKITY